MKKSLVHFLIYLLLLVSCGKKESLKKEYFSTDFLEELDGHSQLLDSIRLYDSINYFNLNIYADHFSKGKFLASQISNLSFYLLDGSGKIERKITQKGQGPGLLGNANFGLGAIGNSGHIYILTAGNSYQLFIYEENGAFVKSFPLFKYMPDAFFPPVNSSFEVIENKDNSILVTFSTGSTLYAHESKEYFENAMGVAQFTIDMDSLKVTEYKAKLPLIQLPEIQEALKDEGFYWEYAFPIFDYENGLFYLTYAFSGEVFVYDQQFNLIDTIDLKTLESIPKKNFTQKIELNDDDFFNRTIKATRRRKENLNIQRINVHNNRLVVQFPEILKEGSYNLPSIGDISGPKKVSHPILQHSLFKNLSTNEEHFVTFPEDHYSISIVDHQDFLVHVIPREREEVFLLKYRLKK
jgi:hypothetical protein